MSDPKEAGREVVAYIKSVIDGGGAVIRTDAALSLSDELSKTQAALAASQADLTAMERERDEARAGLSNALRCFDDLQTAAGRKYSAYEAELASARAELEQLRRDQSRSVAEWRALLGALGIDPDTVETPLIQAKRIGQLAAEVSGLRWQLAAVVQFASAYQPNAERGWAIAILHDKPCATCKQAITCGQAYAPLPGAKGSSVHVVCPPPEDPLSTPVPGHHEGATEQ